jgi:catecholate siderophore receptor
MSSVRVPGSLRSPFGKPTNTSSAKKDVSTTSLLTAACFAAASPASIALAQTAATPAPLPPLSVEAKQPKKKAATPVAKKAGAAPATAAAPTPAPAPGSNPYANPNAPYKVEQSASGKLTEPLVNTPRTVTVTPKEVLDDKSVRDLRDLARSTPGLTIGSAEGGNSYGAFAIRGFKASNDIFVDSIRNPGNVIPDVFSVQQIEIYKGPSGGIAGRSTIGGAVNIITKEPDFRSSFFESTTTLGTDKTFRSTIDVNQKVTPDFAVRANLMYDNHGIAGRDVTDSERWGGLISATGRISDSVKFTLDYYHYRNDAIPDWGVPVRNVDHVPITELGIPRNTWVGMKGLDFFKEEADIVTGMVVAKLAEGVTLTNRSRVGKSRLDYVATSMEGYPDVHHPNRDQAAGIYANQTELLVVFLSAEYASKEWTGLEWRVVRDLIKQKKSSTVMPIRFDETHIPGLFSIDGYVSAAGREPAASIGSSTSQGWLTASLVNAFSSCEKYEKLANGTVAAGASARTWARTMSSFFFASARRSSVSARLPRQAA